MSSHFAREHVQGGGGLRAKDETNGNNHPAEPDHQKGYEDVGMVEDAVKGSGDVICHLDDVLKGTRDLKIHKEDQVVQERCAIVDRWVLIFISRWVRDLGTNVACIISGELSGWVNTEPRGWVVVTVGCPEDGKENAG